MHEKLSSDIRDCFVNSVIIFVNRLSKNRIGATFRGRSREVKRSSLVGRGVCTVQHKARLSSWSARSSFPDAVASCRLSFVERRINTARQNESHVTLIILPRDVTSSYEGVSHSWNFSAEKRVSHFCNLLGILVEYFHYNYYYAVNVTCRLNVLSPKTAYINYKFNVYGFKISLHNCTSMYFIVDLKYELWQIQIFYLIILLINYHWLWRNHYLLAFIICWSIH